MFGNFYFGQGYFGQGAPTILAQISGSSSISFSASSTLRGSGALSGSSSLTFTTSGTVRGAGAIASTTFPAFTLSGTLTGDGALASTINIEFEAGGTLAGAGGQQSGNVGAELTAFVLGIIHSLRRRPIKGRGAARAAPGESAAAGQVSTSINARGRITAAKSRTTGNGAVLMPRSGRAKCNGQPAHARAGGDVDANPNDAELVALLLE